MSDIFDALFDRVAWKPTGKSGDGLYATHEGVLDFCGFHLKVYTLNNGQRVFDADSAWKIFSGDRN